MDRDPAATLWAPFMTGDWRYSTFDRGPRWCSSSYYTAIQSIRDRENMTWKSYTHNYPQIGRKKASQTLGTVLAAVSNPRTALEILRLSSSGSTCAFKFSYNDLKAVHFYGQMKHNFSLITAKLMQWVSYFCRKLYTETHLYIFMFQLRTSLLVRAFSQG